MNDLEQAALAIFLWESVKAIFRLCRRLQSRTDERIATLTDAQVRDEIENMREWLKEETERGNGRGVIE